MIFEVNICFNSYVFLDYSALFRPHTTTYRVVFEKDMAPFVFDIDKGCHHYHDEEDDDCEDNNLAKQRILMMIYRSI